MLIFYSFPTPHSPLIPSVNRRKAPKLTNAILNLPLVEKQMILRSCVVVREEEFQYNASF